MATKAEVTRFVREIYEARKERRAHPDGKFDNQKRWYPNVCEDADGDGSSTRTPSAAWPYSYLLRCRTRQHVKVLVERGLAGLPVPDDVARALKREKTPLLVFTEQAAG